MSSDGDLAAKAQEIQQRVDAATASAKAEVWNTLRPDFDCLASSLRAALSNDCVEVDDERKIIILKGQLSCEHISVPATAVDQQEAQQTVEAEEQATGERIRIGWTAIYEAVRSDAQCIRAWPALGSQARI